MRQPRCNGIRFTKQDLQTICEGLDREEDMARRLLSKTLGSVTGLYKGRIAEVRRLSDRLRREIARMP